MAKLPVFVLSEQWMPIDKIGAECMRERGASSALPPLYFLHIWWARRPLIVCRAAILGSLLPIWHLGWPQKLLDKFPTQKSYEDWFLQLIGIKGDPAVGRRLITLSKERGIRLDHNPYGYKRAFTSSPSQEYLETLGELLEYSWGTRDVSICDPMAGGGSIPFESMRYGFWTYANELNPVASVILKATLEYPSRFGPSLADDIKKWATKLNRRVSEKTRRFYPTYPDGRVRRYLWARTVTCPSTGKPVPLSSNWWLQKGADPIAVRVIAKPEFDVCRFEIVKGKDAIASNPDHGTVKRGVGLSPWTGDPIDGDYIKTEAQAGRMGQQLYALSVQNSAGYDFWPPTTEELAAVSAAEKELSKRLPDWDKQGLVPSEERYHGPADRSINYGVVNWQDYFSPRQLLSILTIVEELRALQNEMERESGEEKAGAIRTYLSFGIDKLADYNSRSSFWHSGRQVMTNTFARHDFGFRWSHGEMAIPDDGLPWAIGQIVDAYHDIAALTKVDDGLFGSQKPSKKQLKLTKGNAAELPFIPNDCMHSLVVDPPYYDNVMYAECSDFFYVWQKRTIGDLYPKWFEDDLTNKDDEAVANNSRFEGAKNKRELATSDYERKMAGCFREMHRILHPDGVLTVMFTHKKVEAWNTLASSLIGAGFSIQTSWPVHTESEYSLHQAKKNSASSTILLVCRKRGQQAEPVWWDAIKEKVREAARSKARAFHAQGISGVDLYISTFGPVLSILSQNWPVLSAETDKEGQPATLRPEIALDLAREEVIALRKEELLLGRKVQFDPITDWYLMAWDAFHAEQFPGDEARKLAIVLGLELESEIISAKRIATKKGADVILQQPIARRKRGMVDDEVVAFDCWLDAAHTAMLVYNEDGSRACEAFLKRSGLLGDSTFKMVLQAMINAIPRTRDKSGQFIRPESRTLDDLRLNFFDDITAPAEEELLKLPEQGSLFAEPEEEADEEEGNEEEGNEE